MGHAGPTSFYGREKKAPRREKKGLQTLYPGAGGLQINT